MDEVKAYKAFVLSFQAFVSGQAEEKGAGHLRSSFPVIGSHGPSLRLSVQQWVCLTLTPPTVLTQGSFGHSGLPALFLLLCLEQYLLLERCCKSQASSFLRAQRNRKKMLWNVLNSLSQDSTQNRLQLFLITCGIQPAWSIKL